MRGLVLCSKGDEANLVGLADLFKRPANPHIARQALAPIGRPIKGGDHDGHREPLLKFSPSGPAGLPAPMIPMFKRSAPVRFEVKSTDETNRE